ncbi:MAG: hypothetical protein M3M96_03870 [Candidatus Eremiobacteraeota bacterium]|nr:hypothetical protein [Candidatus Eremiobacteraeota bacterium]
MRTVLAFESIYLPSVAWTAAKMIRSYLIVIMSGAVKNLILQMESRSIVGNVLNWSSPNAM